MCIRFALILSLVAECVFETGGKIFLIPVLLTAAEGLAEDRRGGEKEEGGQREKKEKEGGEGGVKKNKNK